MLTWGEALPKIARGGAEKVMLCSIDLKSGFLCLKLSHRTRIILWDRLYIGRLIDNKHPRHVPSAKKKHFNSSNICFLRDFLSSFFSPRLVCFFLASQFARD